MFCLSVQAHNIRTLQDF